MAAMMARQIAEPVIADALCQARAVSGRQVLLVVEQLRRAVPGGIGTYVRGLLQGLGELGDPEADGSPSVTLYASRPRREPDPLAALGHALSVSRLPAPLLTRAWTWGLADVPRGPEVIHATSLAAPPARHAPLVVSVQDLAFRDVPEAFPPRGRRWHERAWSEALRRASLLVVPAASVADRVVSAGADRAKVRVVPHGSDHLPPPDDGAAEALLEHLGVPGAFLLSVGTLEPRKNLRRLLAAFAAVSTTWSEEVALVIVGPTGWGDATGDAAVSAPGVHLAGPVAAGTLAALYARALAVAFVPLLEGFGLPVLEAMAAGTPVVASAVPSLDGSHGAALVVDPTDVSSIAEGLSRVVADEALRRALVEAGLRHATALTWARSAAAHVELWRSVG
jgi:glycosyltransferase involved in cell wall biosynthesis